MAMKTMKVSHEQGVEKFLGLTKGIKFCMMTTADEIGVLRSRPMTIQQTENNGNLWFFLGKTTALASAIIENDFVSASFANNCGDAFVSVYGRARLLVDRRKMEELWEPTYRNGFPLGPQDPNLTLLKVELESAEHWDSHLGILTTLFRKVKLPLTSGLTLPKERTPAVVRIS